MARHSPDSGAPLRRRSNRLRGARGLAFISCATVGCGASVEAIYESDVRFEHCMALDARTDVKPVMRRACWAEWVAYYTYGQTRDRLDHAHHRIDQLGDVSDFVVTGEEPTSANDLGVRDHDGRRAAICAGTCEAVRVDCADACEGGVCRHSCAMGFQRCMLTCG